MKLFTSGVVALLAAPALFFALSACGSKEDAGGGGAGGGGLGVEITQEHRDLAKAQFDTLCVTCHGQSGKGDGTAGAALNPKPRDWTDKEWQKTVDDQRLAKVIAEGGQSVGLSNLMTPNPLYKDNPGVIAALVEIVRSYGK